MANKEDVKALLGRPGFWGALAVGLFWLTRSSGLYPGESAAWTAKLVGVWGAWGGLEAHPLVSPAGGCGRGADGLGGERAQWADRALCRRLRLAPLPVGPSLLHLDGQ